jgi:tetraprenyl-beta-curcumene synthase
MLRADALNSIDDKRYYTEGAALFSTLPDRRSRELLCLLTTYQIIANFLDYASERGASTRGEAGGNLMLALSDAVDLDAPLHDYYADHPWKEDGGFLSALVTRCRCACAELPQYGLAQPYIREQARRAEALERCHEPDPARRDAALSALAAREFGTELDVPWFELAGSGTSLLAVIVLLALAAEPTTTRADLESAAGVYCPWVGTLSLLLDSYFDQADDREAGAWSAVEYYPTPEAALQRTVVVARRALTDGAQLRRGARHVLLISMMLALYLSSDNAVSPPYSAARRELQDSVGGMMTRLVPVLRAWRLLYRQRG